MYERYYSGIKNGLQITYMHISACEIHLLCCFLFTDYIFAYVRKIMFHKKCDYEIQ
jgi:hypothetical protein